MKKEKIIEIKEEVKIGNVILEKGDKVKILESDDRGRFCIVSRPCKNFREDTEQCRSGCSRLGLRAGSICPYEVRADPSLEEEPQENCPCYQ